jgi:tetratricopeptide (TPR) repeat protein
MNQDREDNMALKNFFTLQMELIRTFLLEPQQTVRCVQVEPDMKVLLMKALAGMEADENNPHLMLCSEVSFDSPQQFFDDLLRELVEDLAWWEQPLREAGFEFKLRAQELDFLSTPEKFVTYAAKLADCFPDYFGSLLLILVPDRVSDSEQYLEAIDFLARHTRSPWLKYLVVDDRRDAGLAAMTDRNPRIWVQSFHISPEEIESQARADLLDGRALDPRERRQYTALLAGFAFARREYDEALRLQQQWLELIGPDGAPSETANACYNLANTHLARKDYTVAEETYGRALETALDHRLDALVPMVLTNLGVTVYHLGRLEQAQDCFAVARQACRARDLRPMEAHVLDCQARIYAANDQSDEAEQCWNEALAVYDGMTAETFADAREGGKADILEKLGRLATERAKPTPPAKTGWFGRRKGG